MESDKLYALAYVTLIAVIITSMIFLGIHFAINFYDSQLISKTIIIERMEIINNEIRLFDENDNGYIVDSFSVAIRGQKSLEKGQTYRISYHTGKQGERIIVIMNNILGDEFKDRISYEKN